VDQTDISRIAKRRKILNYSTPAAQLIAVVVGAYALSATLTLADPIRNEIAPRSLVDGVLIALWIVVAAFGVWAVRGLRWGRTPVVWLALAMTVVLLLTDLVGLPLQAAGRNGSALLDAIMETHNGVGDGMAAAVLGLPLLATAPIVFAAADSAVVSRWPKIWRWLALVLLGIATYLISGTLLAAFSDLLPHWVLAVLLLEVPLAVTVVLGSFIAITDKQRALIGPRVPTAAELPIPASARRAVTIRWNAPATLLLMVSVLLGILSLLYLLAARNTSQADQAGTGATSWLIGLGLAGASVAVGRAARARAMPTPGEIAELDKRPPILYLRSFIDDNLRVRTRSSARRLWFDNYVSRALTLLFIRPKEPFEEIIVWQLWWHGPVIAVGNPRRKGRRLGSPRLFLSDEEWQHRVSDLMGSASAIVVVLGRTEGLAWELQRIGQLGLEGKLLLALPPVPPQELQARAHAFGELADRAGLPRLPDGIDHALVAVLAPNRTGWQTFTGRRRDEWHYELAMETAVGSLSTDITHSTYPVRRTNRLALVALACSLSGPLTCVGAPAGAILGHVARARIRTTREVGDGVALTAIILGWMITAGLGSLALVALAALLSSRQ
jgi:hypothetical protein